VKLSRLMAVACALLGLAAAMPTAQAQPGRGDHWERLGCVEVGRRPDFDVIPVGRREGRFKALTLEVAGNDVHIDQLRVIYSNGQPDMLAVSADLRAGMRSRPFDLQGWERSIDRIEIVARRNAQSPVRGPAQICVAGLAAANVPPPMPQQVPARWEQLGCQQVMLTRDRDSIHVGRRDGQFRAIRLEVHGNDIQMEYLVVQYLNGEMDRIPMPNFLRQGTVTPPLDLRGDRRVIQRIDLGYRAVPNHRGQAQVCVSGLH